MYSRVPRGGGLVGIPRRLGLYSGYELWRLRLFSFCGNGLVLAALARVVFGAYDSYPPSLTSKYST